MGIALFSNEKRRDLFSAPNMIRNACFHSRSRSQNPMLTSL
jgi:hypothetical protein